MTGLNESCHHISTSNNKTWKYSEYYIGDKDAYGHKEGHGENHWSGAKSLECYSGRIFRDAMHGFGEYRWRYLGGEGARFTYEGHFYCNRMHGFGTMSYPDGKVFSGFFHSNTRWGPGVETQANLNEDVGLWRDTRLVRLTWKPETPSIAPDFTSTAHALSHLQPHRIVLTSRKKTIGDTNSAMDLIKQYGFDPKVAAEKWQKLYPKNCTDLRSALCHVDAFREDYFKGKIPALEEIPSDSKYDKTSQNSTQTYSDQMYYAWNNNRIMVHMMKHSYTHDEQRDRHLLNTSDVVSGPRTRFKPPGKHEIDCRSLLMTSFLGHTARVVRLVNEFGVHPDISDCQGNSAVMYATCGDRTDIIQFLVDAGADVNGCNDSCCTPLGVALLRLVCAQRDVSPSGMLQAVLPPPVSPIAVSEIAEWNLVRELAIPAAGGITRAASKTNHGISKKLKSIHSLKDLTTSKKKIEPIPLKSNVLQPIEMAEDVTGDEKIYNSTKNEFTIIANDIYTSPSLVNPIPYVFEVYDMMQEMNFQEEETKKPAPKSIASKVIKDTIKPSKETMWHNSEKDDPFVDIAEKQKENMLTAILTTIQQLLTNGADPKLVTFPHSALFMAIVSGNPVLVRDLVNHGADINEVYQQTFGYTPLDLAISQPFSVENLNVIKTILDCGAHRNRKLYIGVESALSSLQSPSGPTLLHAVLDRKTQSEVEEEIRVSLLELLLEYGFNPVERFQGRTPVDIAMSKNIYLLDVFIKSPVMNINAVINDANQTILVKMFSLPFFKTVSSGERLHMLTNLLLYGADPLIECKNYDESFTNIFVYAKKILDDMLITSAKPTAVVTSKDSKKAETNKKGDKPKKEPTNTKIVSKAATDDGSDYKQAIDLVLDCARLLHVRWLETKLMKEMIFVIDKYKHRHWSMILGDIKNKKNIQLWLTPQRCLEIWDILKEANKKVFSDNRVLKRLLYITTYLKSIKKFKSKIKPLAQEKNSVEYDVARTLEERKSTDGLINNMKPWKKNYVKPELTKIAHEYKFNICFECALPFNEDKIECVFCKLVSFCSLKCIKTNVERVNCHPCSDILRIKYFPILSTSNVF